MILKRLEEHGLKKAMKGNKVVILFGARQVGKTTLAKKILSEIPDAAYFSCDEPDVKNAFEGKTSSEMMAFLKGVKTVVLDEAQNVENIGLSLKLLHDAYPKLKIMATGSSSFDLANKTSEPLTGRNVTFILYPASYEEYKNAAGDLQASRLLEERILYGMYPGVINANNPEAEVKSLARDYLFKDVLRIDSIRRPIILEKLTQLLAWQTGQLVSYNEIAQKMEISRQTVMNYIRLLEQAFILFRVPPLSSNPRSEVTRFEKVYFYDTGIRNALINDFSSLDNRFDKGALFENFFLAERLKKYQIEGKDVKQYFWRTKDGSEIDLVEKHKNKLTAFECKWNEKKVNTRAWYNAFPDVLVNVVNRASIWDFL